VDNREKVLEALRTSGPVGYAELEELSGVPSGSFGRVLGQLVRSRAIAKYGDRYHPDSLGDGSGDGSGDAKGEVGGFDSATYRGMWAYCRPCDASHPKRRSGEWPSFDEACRLGITA
jgi:hypothetical protein